MSEDEIEEPYDVGYGKPPKHTRWQKGVSGNPGGGKKLVRTLSQDITKALNVQVAITQNGERHMMSKRLAILTQAINKAAGGDPKSTRLVLDLARQAESEEALLAAVANAKSFSSNLQIFQLPDNGR